MKNATPLILAVGMAIAVAGLYAWDRDANQAIGRVTWLPSVSEDVPENIQPTYTPPQNIYLPEMMFLVVKDIDKPAIARCKNMAYRTVDLYSRRENNNLAHADMKMHKLARIVYDECIDVVLITYKKGI